MLISPVVDSGYFTDLNPAMLGEAGVVDKLLDCFLE
jgi:hypothetical protein